MDSTVGTVVATVRPFGSRTIPPVGEFRPTLKNFGCKFPLSALFLQGIYAKKGKDYKSYSLLMTSAGFSSITLRILPDTVIAINKRTNRQLTVTGISGESDSGAIEEPSLI